MRRNTAIVLVTLVAAIGVVTVGVVTAGVGFPLGTASADSALQAAPNGTTVHVSASGSASAAPDVAVLSVAVVANANTADAARAAVAENASSLRDALKAAGVSADDVKTTTYRVDERTTKRPVPVTAGASGSSTASSGGSSTRVDVQHTYEAVHGFEVTVRDPSRAGDVLDAAVSGGANRVNGVRFTLSDATRSKLRTEAIHGAMHDARTQATAVTDASGLTLTSLQTVTVGGSYPVPVAYSASGASGGANARTVVDHGPVTVTVSVQATYAAS